MPHKLTKIKLQSELNGIVVEYHFTYYEGGHDQRLMASRSEGPFLSLGGRRNRTSVSLQMEEESLRRGFHEVVVTRLNLSHNNSITQVNRHILGYPVGYEYRVR